MDKTHVKKFAHEMARGDVNAAFDHVSEHIELRSPIFEEPFVGKVAVRHIMSVVSAVLTDAERTGAAESDDRIVTFKSMKIGTLPRRL